VESIEGPVCVCPIPITPNRDGYNDYLRFDYSLRYPRSSPRIEIFDLAGHMVYSSDRRSVSWTDVRRECGGCPRICPDQRQCELLFDGSDSDGNLLPGGLYLYVFYLNGQPVGHGEAVIAR